MITYLLLSTKYVMRCAIWYHLYNSKNMKNTHGGVLILVKLQVQIAQHTTYFKPKHTKKRWLQQSPNSQLRWFKLQIPPMFSEYKEREYWAKLAILTLNL